MQSDEEQIRTLVDVWTKATKEGDVAAVLDLMADDVVFLVCGRPPMRGKAAFEATARVHSLTAGAPAPPRVEGHSDIQEIVVRGDLAYMWTNMRVEITPPNGQTNIRSGYTLTVFRKESGRWLLARDANLLS